MTDKKCTDEEIIKSLECCKNCCCKQCDEEPDFQEAINLINHQKTEIERLKDYNSNLIDANTALSKEILEIKAEAYKEFAEKLKVAAISCSIGGRYYKIFTIRDIDNLLKEMVGEEGA